MRARGFLLASVCLCMLLGPSLRTADGAPTGDWTTETIDGAGPEACSMAMDGDDRPFIACKDADTHGLECARWNGRSWSVTPIDVLDIFVFDIDVAIDSAGNPVVAYTDYLEGPGTLTYQLKLATYSGTAWTRSVVTEMEYSSWGYPVSIALDAQDHPHIAWYDDSGPALMCSVWDGSRWQSTRVLDRIAYRFDIAVDATGAPRMVASDAYGAKMLYMWLDGGRWRNETVATGPEAGLFLSLALDRDGHPRIAYMQSNAGGLKYAQWSGTAWDLELIEGGVGVGYFASLVLDRWDRPHIAYRASGTTPVLVKYATFWHDAWAVEVVEENYGAYYESICLNSTQSPRMCYGSTSAGTLRYAVHVPNHYPNVPSRPAGPTLGLPGARYGYTARTTDLEGDNLEYVFDWGDGTTSTSKTVASGATADVAHTWDRSGNFSVRVRAVDEVDGASAWSPVLRVLIDNAPNVPEPPSGPAACAVAAPTTFMTNAIDPDGDNVRYVFEVVTGQGPSGPIKELMETPLMKTGGKGSVAVEWAAPGNYSLRARTVDELGLASPWSAERTVVVSTPPAAPAKPSGQAKCQQGEVCNFSASSTDADGDMVKYVFDWNATGNGTTTETGLVGSGETATASHSWAAWGTFPVKVRAVDEHGIASAWSDPLEVAVNVPPGAPSPPAKPAKATAGKSVELTASAADPDGDMVKLVFDWGDGNATGETGYFPPGTPVNLSHSWKKAGTYKVRVKAVDADGGESAWSEPVDVVVKAKARSPGPAAAAAAVSMAAAAIAVASRARRSR